MWAWSVRRYLIEQPLENNDRHPYNYNEPGGHERGQWIATSLFAWREAGAGIIAIA